jgi:hypothetical protein
MPVYTSNPVEVTLIKTDGKKMKKRVVFTLPSVRLGTGELVTSDGLVKVATGKKLNENEVKTPLNGLTKEAAVARIEQLLLMNYKFLEEAPPEK